METTPRHRPGLVYIERSASGVVQRSRLGLERLAEVGLLIPAFERRRLRLFANPSRFCFLFMVLAHWGCESRFQGRVPLHTLRADIDYGFAEAHTTMGQIGIKAWIYKGEILPAVARGKAEGELERR